MKREANVERSTRTVSVCSTFEEAKRGTSSTT